MKKAIILKNCSDYASFRTAENYAEYVYVDNADNGILLKKYKLDFFLFIEDLEEIVFCKNFTKNSKTFISDGNWMILQNRIYPETNQNEEPVVIKSNKYLQAPFLKNQKLINYFREKKYSEFCLEGEKFIFDNPEHDDVFLPYYLALSYFFKLNQPMNAQKHIAFFINKYKNFAEGWCCLGDFFVYQKRHLEAIKAYENAQFYCKQRNIYDGIPVSLKKYTTYPQDMITKIRNQLENTAVLSINGL